jgi:putative copper resistance protein D
MRPDTLSVIFRSASFIAMFQATGMAVFLALFGRLFEVSRLPLRTVARITALAAAMCLIVQYALEAARMADDLSGIADRSLQGLAMHSARSVVLAIRLIELTLVWIFAGRRRLGSAMSVLVVGMIAVSFALTGHTASSPSRWILAPLLSIHVVIVTFWFGALAPLYVISVREAPSVAGRVIEAFSAMAQWLVPGIFLAGMAMTMMLLHHIAELESAYGRLLLAKFTGFTALMGLAALNRWRLGPAVATGNMAAIRSFRRSLGVEYVFFAGVLSVTALMTTLYSPEE